MQSTMQAAEVIPYYYAGRKTSAEFHVQVNATAVPVMVVPEMEATEAAALADVYRERYPVYTHMAHNRMVAHMAYCAVEGTAEIRIDTGQPVAKAQVHPLVHRVPVQIDGNAVTFTAHAGSPRYYLVEIDDLPLLAIVLDAYESAAPQPGDTGVVDAGVFLQGLQPDDDATPAIRQAIAVAVHEGKTLYLPSGTYTVDTITLHRITGLTLYFAPGCLLRIRPSLGGESRHVHGIWLDECEDITLSGRGMLDHQGYEHFALAGNPYQHGLLSYYVPNAECPFLTQSPINITRCARIVINDLLVCNSRNFNVNIRHSDAVSMRGVKIVTPGASTPEYGDGFQINSSRDVELIDCFCWSNDDYVAVGHYFYSIDDRSTERVLVQGLVGWNGRANGVRLGFYTHYPLSDLRFSRCHFTGYTCEGIIIHPLQDAEESRHYPRYGDVRFEECSFDLPEQTPRPGFLCIDGARMSTVSLTNIQFNRPTTRRSRLSGHPHGGIEHLVLKQITFDGQPCADIEAMHVVTEQVQAIEV